MGDPRRHGVLLIMAIGLGLGCLRSQAAQATPEDSGWVTLTKATGFGDAFYVYSNGFVPIATQTKFKLENGMIHAGGPYALLVTVKEFSFYRIRVEYRFGGGVGPDGNAGMMILMDNEAAKTSTLLRPRSIEVNCRRDNNYPWSLWSAKDAGPVMSSTVQKGSARFRTLEEGGVAYRVDPSGNRTLESSYANPERPVGEWNRGEGAVFGDSGVFHLNGELRSSSWHWLAGPEGKTLRVARGGVGIQTEGSDIWYRNWEIQELDSATRLPIHARRGCTDSHSPKYDPRAVLTDGSCGAVSTIGGNRDFGLRKADPQNSGGQNPDPEYPDHEARYDVAGKRIQLLDSRLRPVPSRDFSASMGPGATP